MGIKGLPAFIRSKAQHAIRDVKLSSLHGRTVAIDGNILTLRFHHSNESQHPNRTILSWYRFIRNLESYAIKPIVVFDGSKRVPAKAKELERRYNARRLLAGRAESEEARFVRLRCLQTVADEMQELDVADRTRVINDTHKILEEATVEVPAPTGPALFDSSLSLSSRFAGLVLDMQAFRVADEGTLTKRQLLMAQNEAKAFTRALAQEVEVGQAEIVEEDENPLEALHLVLEESRCVADTYLKRSTSVSKQTHTDCMDVLKAMGVPVLLTSNTEPQEAESLCSSLVSASFADMVVSEDTDVLVFEAPLLRGLSAGSREGELMNGHEVRKELRFQSKEMWIDFCLLCGSDFTDRIKGFGPMKAYKAVLKHGSIEAILASEDLLLYPNKLVTPPIDIPAYLDEIQAARAIFLTPVPVSNYSSSDFERKNEHPDLMGTMRSFGLDAARDDARQRSGFETIENPMDSDTMESAFGLASLGDSPHIEDGQREPFPAELRSGGSKL